MSTPRGSLPRDPMDAVAMGATATHTMYEAYVKAGFSEEQALQITIALMVNSINRALQGE